MTTAGSLERLSTLIEDAKSVILTTADLDGDSVGTLIALHDLIGQLNPSVSLELVFETPLPKRYEFLISRPSSKNCCENGTGQGFNIVVDSEPSRFGSLRKVFNSRGSWSIDTIKLPVFIGSTLPDMIEKSFNNHAGL